MSQASFKMFLDGAQFYSGPPVTAVDSLLHYEGETLRMVISPGPEQTPPVVVSGGIVTLPHPATDIWIGLPYKARFKSLKLDASLGGSLNRQQRVTGCIVSMKTALAHVGLDGQQLMKVSPRTSKDVIPAFARRIIKPVTFPGDTDQDPRIVVEDDTAYEGFIYSLKPEVSVGG